MYKNIMFILLVIIKTLRVFLSLRAVKPPLRDASILREDFRHYANLRMNSSISTAFSLFIAGVPFHRGSRIITPGSSLKSIRGNTCRRKSKKLRSSTGGFSSVISYTPCKASGRYTDTLRFFLKAVGKTLCCVWISISTAYAEPGDNIVYELDIPAQPLIKSLNALSNQTETLVLFPYDLVNNRKSSAVKGRYTVRQALDAMLVGTDLKGELSEKGVLGVSARTDENKHKDRVGEMRNKKSLLAILVGSFFAAGDPQGLLAQENHEGGELRSSRAVLEEVVVTAQRREQGLQEVPVAVSALSSYDLEMQGISGISDLSHGAVPSLNAQEFGSRPGAMQMSIRGVGAADASEVAYELTVAVYADGVYLARAQGLGLDMLELERVEILRGPQGSLFGRNAVGGAINLVPRKPGGEFRFRQNVEHGRFNTWKSHTTMETKEWNSLSFKLDYFISDTDGWMSNPAPGQNDFSTSEQQGWRIAARWQPTDTVTADYAYDETRLDFIQGYNHLTVPTTVPALQPIMEPFVHENRRSRIPQPGLWAPESSNDVLGHSLTLEWGVNDNLSFKSITAYRENDVNIFAPLGFGILSPGANGFLGGNASAEIMGQEQFSQELQLFGSFDRLEYTLGALYFEEKSDSTNWNINSLLFSFTPGATGEMLDPVIEGPRTETSLDSKSIGIYGQATWTPPILDDRLHITAGVRYSKDEKDLLRSLLNGQPMTVPIEANEERVDPALTLAYDLAEDVSTYIRWATAYRAGGASIRELPLASDPTDSGFNPFDAEEVEVFELGLKSEFMDRRIRFNAALFYQNYDNKQTGFQKAGVSNVRIFNIDKTVRISGAETDLTWAATDQLTLTFAGTWLRNSLNRIANPATGVEEPFRLAQLPDFRWATSMDYQFLARPLGGDMSFFASLTGSSDYCFNERSCFGRFDGLRGGSGKTSGDDNTLLNARLTLSNLELASGRFSVALWGKNLLDQEYYSYGFMVPGLEVGVVNFGEPRTYGLSATYEY